MANTDALTKNNGLVLHIFKLPHQNTQLPQAMTKAELSST